MYLIACTILYIPNTLLLLVNMDLDVDYTEGYCSYIMLDCLHGLIALKYLIACMIMFACKTKLLVIYLSISVDVRFFCKKT